MNASLSTGRSRKRKSYNRPEGRCYVASQSKKFGDSEGGETIVCESLFGKYPLWKSEWSVPGAKMLPSGQFTSDDNSGLVAFVKAKGRNSLSFCLSPEQAVASSGVYEIIIGSMSNAKSCIKKNNEEVASLPHSGFKLCNALEYMELYIACVENVIAIGIGDKVGDNIILKYVDLETPIIARYLSFSSWNFTNRYILAFINSSAKAGLNAETLALSENYFVQDNYKVSKFRKVTEEDLEARRKRQQRFHKSANFSTEPVLSNEEVVQGIFKLLQDIKVKRKDLLPNEQLRSEAILVFGNFDGKYTDHVFEWFAAFTNDGKINWLHDYALNFLFLNQDTMMKAYMSLSEEIPDTEDSQYSEEIKQMKNSKWRYAQKWGKIFLLRPSSVTDVKRRSDSGYRNHENFPGDNRKKIRKLVAEMNQMESE